MADPVTALLAINARQADGTDTADADLLALQSSDGTSLVVSSPDRTTTLSYVDAAGAKHCLETVRP